MCNLCPLERPISEAGAQLVDGCKACPSGTKWDLTACTAPPAEQQAVQVELTIKVPITEYKKDPVAFKDQIASDLSKSTGVAKERFEIVKVYEKDSTQGRIAILADSVGVVFNIKPDANDQTNTPVKLFRDIDTALKNTSSTLYTSSTYLSKTDSNAPLKTTVVTQCPDGSYQDNCSTNSSNSTLTIVLVVLGICVVLSALFVVYRRCNAEAKREVQATNEVNMNNI